MKRFFVALIGLGMTCGALAEEAAVVARTDCTTLKQEIDELTQIEAPDTDTTEKLAALQVKYRADCAKRTMGRRTNMRVTAAVVSPVKADKVPQNFIDTFIAQKGELCEKLKKQMDELTPKTDEESKTQLAALQTQYDTVCAEKEKATAETETTVVELTPEQVAENIEHGLCGDGSKPNKYGCCGDEKFTDMGNLVFACCPASGWDCFPPITRDVL